MGVQGPGFKRSNGSKTEAHAVRGLPSRSTCAPPTLSVWCVQARCVCACVQQPPLCAH